MGGTLDQFFIQIEELVFLPFQVGTGMRAFIVVCEEFTIFMDEENRPGLAFDFDLETFAAGVFDIGGFADNMGHDVW